MMPRRAVFVDRDGVINKAIIRDGRSLPPYSLSELEILPGVPEAVDRLRAAGFLVIVATNQPDVATGILRREVVDDLNDYIRRHVVLDDVRVCVHRDEDACACRKPKPGMLLDAARQFDVDLVRSFMVGDRWRDIDAGNAAGCRTILVGAQRAGDRQAEGYWASAAGLPEAVEIIINGSGRPEQS